MAENLKNNYYGSVAKAASEADAFTNAVEGAGTQIKATAGEMVETFQDADPVHKVVYALGTIVVIIKAFQIIKKIYNIILYKRESSPWIIRGTRDASKRLVIRQDPSKSDSIQLRRSENQYGGLEFTYMWWMYINDSGDSDNKVVFYKGDSAGETTYAPKVILEQGNTVLTVLMNTFENEDNKVFVHNIPVKKWIHVVLSVRQRDIDVYVNGELSKRKVLHSIPKQNNGDLYISPNKGVNGNNSNFKYFNYFVTFKEIDQYLQLGPSKKPQIEEGDRPPYFSSNWWINN